MRLSAKQSAVLAVVIAALACAAVLFGMKSAAKTAQQAALQPAQHVTVTAPAASNVNGVSGEPAETEDDGGLVLGASDEESEAEVVPDPEKPEVFGWPLTHAPQRANKKPFGMFITPETSPVPGDRFSGYHVGVDFETTEDEADVDVGVFAICDGPLLFGTWANGYGGVAVQSCSVDGEEVHVIYGHLNEESIVPKAGDEVETGDLIALLGAGHTEEVDGVRKHLHLGIRRKDEKPDIKGYVKTEEDMAKFMDALEVIGSEETEVTTAE